MFANIALALWFLLYALAGFGLIPKPDVFMNVLALIIGIGLFIYHYPFRRL